MTSNDTIYTTRMKVADLLTSDSNLLSILQRFGIKLGFGEATVAEICHRYGISTDLFLSICNIYSFKEYYPQIESLGKNDIKSLTEYLRVSHRYYTTVCLPSLHNKIHQMVKELDDVSRRLIDKFYDDYDSEASKHFEYEEDVVFPYIESLATGQKTDKNGYNITQFEENHSNIGEKLNDLKNIITKYLDEQYSSPFRFELLVDLNNIEKDLRNHSDIENKLLIPLVEKTERQYE